MPEEVKIIIAIVLLFSSVIALLIVFLYTKKVVKKEKEIVNKLEEETYKYYQNLKLLDDKYFPYFHTHASGLRSKKGSIGDKDNITNIEAFKNRVFFFDRILYIINNQLHGKFEKEIIDGQEYIIIDDKIKTIELLVSFEKPSHFLVKYQVIKVDKNKYKLEIIKEDEVDERRNNESN
ncbi:MAG: hypothetical protein E7177_07280 [Erysipelotrichaceae bacterium]|nr:hypothetical protein [Erysipelotrichaceae bacterium]